jgi:hypothetical protein
MGVPWETCYYVKSSQSLRVDVKKMTCWVHSTKYFQYQTSYVQDMIMRYSENNFRVGKQDNTWSSGDTRDNATWGCFKLK